MKTRQRLLGLLVAAALVVLIGGLAVFLVRVPEVTDQLPLEVSSVVVTLSAPSSDAQVPLNQFTTVSAEAVGVKSITALELWIDGTPSGTQNAPAGSTLNRLNAFWTWTPVSEGEHTLLVRAIDADHKIGMSNIVRVTASGEANAAPSVAIETKPGDTIASIAHKVKADPQQIVDLNPQIDPSSPVISGETITVPIPMPPPPTPTPEASPSTPPEPPGNPNQPPANGNPSKYQVWWNQNILKQFSAIKPAAAPGLAASAGAGKCSIDLYIYDKSDNEDGFFLYKLAPNAGSFERIATLDAHSGAQPIHYVDPVPTGKYEYYVSSFNAMGESPSKIVMAAIIEPCVAPQQQSLDLSNAIVTVDQPVDKIYCYLQIDNGLWTRVPPGPDTFITPSQPGQFDLSQYLKSLTPPPPPPQITLHLECWGWNGGTLMYLGEATETIKQGQVQLKAPHWQFAAHLSPQIQQLYKDPVSLIAPPIHASLTGDPHKCADDHGMAFSECDAYAAMSWVFFTWDWWDLISGPPCLVANCITDIDGFHVYFLYPNDPTPHFFATVATPTLAESQTLMAFTFWPRDSTNPNLMFVRAFKGGLESADSNYVPMQVKTGTVTVDIPAGAATWTFGNDAHGCPDYWGNSPYWGSYNPSPGPVVVGFEFRGDPCDYANVVEQGLVWFDLSKIPPGDIQSASLKYKWKGSVFSMGTGFPPKLAYSCVNQLMVGINDWRNGALPIYADPYKVIPWAQIVDPSAPPQYSDDVTIPVEQWRSGTRPNYGFVFIGPYGDVSQPWGDQTCITAYGDFILEVQVQVSQ